MVPSKKLPRTPLGAPVDGRAFPSLAFASLLALVPMLPAAAVKDLAQWAPATGLSLDASKPGPDGSPSFKLEPKGHAALKLRDADGSGKVTLYVYDDGAVASPNKQKSVGPRWGLAQADGRILVGAIMYARFLQPEGSLCLFDTDPKDKQAWLNMNFLAPRGKPGWKKWEFEYDPDAGLKIKVDDKPVPPRYFDWNKSKATGFNGLVLYGDDSPGTPQTIWVGGISVELGGPMKVKPNPEIAAAAALAALPPAPIAVALDEGAAPVPFPGETLRDDLKGLKVPLVEGYASARPRLLFSAQERAALQQKAKENAAMWDVVIANASQVASVPTPDVISSGAKYWRISCVDSAALAWFVTGDAKWRDGAVQWMTAHCKEKAWGTGFRPNLDLVASWYLYSISLAYDVFGSEIPEADRAVIREGLAQHARAICASFALEGTKDSKDQIRYDQNHTYIPAVALASTALALVDEVPDAKEWLRRAYAVMRRCRYALNEDGYYYEGFGYWSYALHWHVRYADLLSRATGEKPYELPALRDNWRFAVHLSLPGAPNAFDVGDTGFWGGDKPRPSFDNVNAALLGRMATALSSRESRVAYDLYRPAKPDTATATMDFLWGAPSVAPMEMEKIARHHRFADMDVVTWRSGWKPGATCYFFRCGPPLGHAATAKLGRMKDWTMNCGHVHPDIGAFYMHAKGAYLAVTTGYTSEKWTRDHNTLLVDGKGQAMDGAYHNERGIPYATLDQAKIDRCWLGDAYGFASGEFGSAYARQVRDVKLRRSALMTERWLLLVDDMSSPADRTLTWLCHADSAFQAEGAAFAAKGPKATLAVLPLAPAGLEPKMEPTVVVGGATLADTKPGSKVTIQRGFTLGLSTKQPAKAARLVTLLVPLAMGEKQPEVQAPSIAEDRIQLSLRWPNGKTEKVDLNLKWQGESGAAPGPAAIISE
jgi:hypothetical protein